jgi:TetR/AcrR family transcriptional regulator, transcriptional repressor for nem operon
MQIALKLFLQKTYKEVTMKELVEKTNLSKGAFYHYFESKEQLFEEIINAFYFSISQSKYSNLNEQRLYDFYNKNIENMNDFSIFEDENEKPGSEIFLNINFFSLLFDAFKLFPDFRLKMQTYHKSELEIWKLVIASARKKNEIQSEMDDELIAKLFIFSSDGLAMNLTMHKSIISLRSEMKVLWDNLYNTIKV